MADKEIDKPFQVTTTTGNFRSGHDTIEAATYAAAEANDNAIAMGIQTRYVAGPNPK